MIFWGWRTYGRIRTQGGLTVATRFFHIFWLPIVPYRGLILIKPDQGVKGRMRLRSVMVGYGKVWGPLLLAVGLFVAVNPNVGDDRILLAVAYLIVGALLSTVAYLRQFLTYDDHKSAEIQAELQRTVA